MRGPGLPQLLIILFIVLLFVGSKKLPGLASSIGTSLKEFRRSAGDAIGGSDADDADAPTADTAEGGPADAGGPGADHAEPRERASSPEASDAGASDHDRER